ncbi:hypothetical protein Purlil1_4231 [Purpureocillium lilacinum]|uniref:Uncharacterized protein n=1 Tax=Purpureocillium lilacinum TaxID=33203 RepID=A0ABR0C4G8_PURLI|nr:hypothetical protein Purlil1_4231 [Purpureocillium lilacinum]
MAFVQGREAWQPGPLISETLRKRHSGNDDGRQEFATAWSKTCMNAGTADDVDSCTRIHDGSSTPSHLGRLAGEAGREGKAIEALQGSRANDGRRVYAFIKVTPSASGGQAHKREQLGERRFRVSRGAGAAFQSTAQSGNQLEGQERGSNDTHCPDGSFWCAKWLARSLCCCAFVFAAAVVDRRGKSCAAAGAKEERKCRTYAVLDRFLVLQMTPVAAARRAAAAAFGGRGGGGGGGCDGGERSAVQLFGGVTSVGRNTLDPGRRAGGQQRSECGRSDCRHNQGTMEVPPDAAQQPASGGPWISCPPLSARRLGGHPGQSQAKPCHAMPCHAMPCPPMVVLPWQRMGSGLGPGIPRALAPPPPPSLRAPYHVRSKVALVSDLQAARGSTGLLGCCRRSTIGIRVASCTSTGQHDQHERRWHQHAAASPPPAAPAPASTPRDEQGAATYDGVRDGAGWMWRVGAASSTGRQLDRGGDAQRTGGRARLETASAPLARSSASAYEYVATLARPGQAQSGPGWPRHTMAKWPACLGSQLTMQPGRKRPKARHQGQRRAMEKAPDAKRRGGGGGGGGGASDDEERGEGTVDAGES